MSRIILALALASSVSALLLPRGAAMSTAPLGSSALLSVRSRPLYMSIDPAALTKIAAAGYSAGFSDGQNAAATLAIAGDAKVEGPSALVQPADEELHRFKLAEEKVFDRFDMLSPEIKKSITGCVKELLETTTPEYKERREWWTAWQNVNGHGTDLRAFFQQWMVCPIVPGDGTHDRAPSTEHPAGVGSSPSYLIVKWDWLVNTKVGLKLDPDKEWRAWFVDFLNVRGLYINTTASYPPEVKKLWEGSPVGVDAYFSKATGKRGLQHPFDISTYLLPSGGFDTFNGFFLRWVKDIAKNRPLEPADKDDPFSIVSPSDGGLFYLSEESTAAGYESLPGKYDHFNVVEAFPGYGEKFVGGPLLDNFLWFSDFHHFFAPVSGTLVSMHEYPGSYNYDFDDFDPYHPTYKAKGTSDQAGWYQQLAKHKRFVWIFKTEKLGLVAMAAIGFLGVGSIVVDDRLYPQTWAGGPIARDDPSPGVSPGKGGDLTPAVKIGDTVTKGSYLGHFGYGGSSIVLAFQPEVNGKSLSYNFAASPTGAPSGSAPLPIENYDGPIQVKALQQIGVAKLE